MCCERSSAFLRRMVYDIGVVCKRLYIRHHATVVSHASDVQGTARGVLAWCTAAGEAVVKPKRTSTRGDKHLSRTPAEYSGRCRNSLYTTPVSLIDDAIYDTAPRSRHTLWIVKGLSRVCQHSVQLSLKLSWSKMGQRPRRYYSYKRRVINMVWRGQVMVRGRLGMF